VQPYRQGTVGEGRSFEAYDLLKSDSGFTDGAFETVWNGVFDFCARQSAVCEREVLSAKLTVEDRSPWNRSYVQSWFCRPPIAFRLPARPWRRSFACAVDPTVHFRARWGESYKANLEALWRRCVESYLAGDPAPSPADELLMCLAYDVILGPSLGVPGPHKLPFLRWLIAGVRREVT
jgi:hypothetical protein